MSTQPSKQLEVVPNPHPDRDYEVSLEIPEFTCLCPRTGQPDFATIRIRYVPDQRLVELKSIKLYVWSYRDEGAFHEDVTNRILNDFVAVAARTDRGALRKEIRRRGWDFPVGFDRDGAIFARYGIIDCPTMVFAYPGGIAMRTTVKPLRGGKLTAAVRRLVAGAERRGWRPPHPARRGGGTP